MKYARDLDSIEAAKRASEFWQWGILSLILIFAGALADIALDASFVCLGIAVALAIGISIHAKRRLFRD